MRFLKALPLLLIPILFYQFQKEIKEVGPVTNPVIIGPEPINAKLQGNVFDENDQPAQGVTITVGLQTSITDARGYFRINNATLDKKSALVTAEKTGYFKAYRTFSATSGTNQVVIKLLKKTLAGTVDASLGGSVTMSNGARVTLPANGIVKSSTNTIYSGTINVYAAYIDPTLADIGQTVPGSFLANDKNGSRVTLNSFGMMAVELESPSAEKLQVKTGSVAILTTPIPASLTSTAPSSLPMCYVDEASGIWKEEGIAVKQGTVYVGEVKHFTYWNCVTQLPTVNITATIKNAAGQVIPYACVGVILAGSTSNAYYVGGWSDSLGQISGAVPSNQNLVLKIQAYPCPTTIYSQNIGPFAQSTNLGDIVIPASAMSAVTGHLNNCAGANVTNGYALLVNNYIVQYAPTDVNGNFSAPMLLCSSPNMLLQAIGVDESTQQQSNPVYVNLAAPTTSLGVISACGTASNQYVSYTFDGTNYTYNDSSPVDSLAMSSQQLWGATTYYTKISCKRTTQPGDNLLMFFDHPSLLTGTYTLSTIRAQTYFNNTVLQPSNITLTSFPQMVGQFYEGSFSGQFKDDQNVTHTVTNGVFRIRKNW
jgi:hypothetical protein